MVMNLEMLALLKLESSGDTGNGFVKDHLYDSLCLVDEESSQIFRPEGNTCPIGF